MTGVDWPHKEVVVNLRLYEGAYSHVDSDLPTSLQCVARMSDMAWG
jgi:hypothetical protein